MYLSISTHVLGPMSDNGNSVHVCVAVKIDMGIAGNTSVMDISVLAHTS